MSKTTDEFMYLFRTSATSVDNAMGTPERAQRSLETWLAWIRDLESKGHLKSPGMPLERTGGVVRGQNKLVTDGPYTEAKDMVLGFIVVSARNLAHALELAAGCPILNGGGSVEVRPVAQLGQ